MKPIVQFFAEQLRDADMAYAKALDIKTALGEVEPPGSELLVEARQVYIYRTAQRALAIAYFQATLVAHEDIERTDWSTDRLVADAYERAR